jgi:hypothetical protein
VSRTTGSAVRRPVPLDAPPPTFEHLLRLSDETGLLEHARGAMPRRNHGYCVDDNARALLVISLEPDPPAEAARLAERCLTFLAHAQAPDGRFQNRLGYDRRFEDEPGEGDWWGRALWGLGIAAAANPTGWVRIESLTCFTEGCGVRTDHPRAMAYAALGAAAVVRAHPGHGGARRLLVDAAAVIGQPSSDPAWPWPAKRLTYGNATMAEALVVAGSALGDERLVQDGLVLLDWLLSTEVPGDHLSLTPVHGWALGEARPAFDQQPIEAAAMADACGRAHDVTGDPRWLDGVDAAVRWFLGDNDIGIPMFDPSTGGGYDGLEAGGRNANQGAESTLAFISTMQWARVLAGSSR